ncbi:MAG: DUF1294 domain-containing protein [Acetobacter sp.]|nr:DUF1294 domain-containing protein [Bacteroides sp.]MCM1340534.1 DUF1294 domain-containing protein [Acetobacter sp.]MCM1433274.1 DUF1294 domain-containing protein [Clostridiales bacterium]
MNKYIILGTLIYFSVISLISSLTAFSDKKRAISNKQRIPEKTLMLLGLFGGAAAEYITMKKIHHKTRHKKFMIGLPLEVFFHLVTIIIFILKTAT